MQRLTDNEILFCKLTGFTATVIQCDEWYRTIWKQCPTYQMVLDTCQQHGIDAVSDKDAAYDFWVDLVTKICNDDDDAISLEDVAIYLLRTFCSKKQLEDFLNNDSGTKWLSDWKYFFGFRKLEDAYPFVEAALDIQHYQLMDTEDNSICYTYIDDDVLCPFN